MTQKAIMEYQNNVSIHKNIKLLDIFVEKKDFIAIWNLIKIFSHLGPREMTQQSSACIALVQRATSVPSTDSVAYSHL